MLAYRVNASARLGLVIVDLNPDGGRDLLSRPQSLKQLKFGKLACEAAIEMRVRTED